MIWAGLWARLGGAFSALGAVALAILAAFAVGRRTEKNKAEVNDLKQYKETKEKIDAVAPSPDRPAAVKRLRDNGLLR